MKGESACSSSLSRLAEEARRTEEFEEAKAWWRRRSWGWRPSLTSRCREGQDRETESRVAESWWGRDTWTGGEGLAGERL